MSIHVHKCQHNGEEEFHLRYPGMSEEAAQGIASRINSGGLLTESQIESLQNILTKHGTNRLNDAVGDALEFGELRAAWSYGSEVCFPVPVPRNTVNGGHPPLPPWSCCSRSGVVVYGATPMEAIRLAMRTD
jgi:hypothetical protein